MLAWIAAGLSVVIYEMLGTWPAEYVGLAPVLFVLLGAVLIGYAWQAD